MLLTPVIPTQLVIEGLDVTSVGIEGLATLDADDAAMLVATLDRTHTSLNWWAGDFALEQLIRARDGDRSLDGVPMLSDQPSNARAVRVAIAFADHQRRRPALSWSHHAHVCHLSDAHADRLLDVAEQEALTAHGLSALIRQEREDLNPPLDDGMNRRVPMPPKKRIRDMYAADPHGGYVASFDDPDVLVPLDADAVARVRAAMGGTA